MVNFTRQNSLAVSPAIDFQSLAMLLLQVTRESDSRGWGAGWTYVRQQEVGQWRLLGCVGQIETRWGARFLGRNLSERPEISCVLSDLTLSAGLWAIPRGWKASRVISATTWTETQGRTLHKKGEHAWERKMQSNRAVALLGP